MIVDCEIYYHGPDRSLGGQVFGIEQLEELCRAAGVDKAVLMPTPTFYPRNHLVAEVLKSHPGARGRFVGCALVNPHFGDDAVGVGVSGRQTDAHPSRHQLDREPCAPHDAQSARAWDSRNDPFRRISRPPPGDRGARRGVSGCPGDHGSYGIQKLLGGRSCRGEARGQPVSHDHGRDGTPLHSGSRARNRRGSSRVRFQWARCSAGHANLGDQAGRTGSGR